MKGLSTVKAEALLKEYGLNNITEGKKKNFLFKLVEQFNNFLTFLLLGAAFLSFVIGEPVDGLLILVIVFLNGLFGLYQELKAEESIAALKKMTVTKVRVMRDNRQIDINSIYLVPGDHIYVEEGTKIPSDGVVTESFNLEINESALTGESMPVPKKNHEEIYSGTIVSKGRGWIEVTKTGMKTKFGQIAESLSTIEETKTPLQKKIESLTKIIGLLGIVISLVVFAISIFQGSGYFPSFLLAISLAVAVVPEGLPAVMTITLAIGVGEMAKKKSIIRKLSAIEALGSITLIATDKTGTLTTNKMKVKEIYVDDKVYQVEKPPTLTNHSFSLLVLNGILCSTASLVYVHDRQEYDVLGDPTEGALLFLAHEIGLMPDMVREEWKLVDEKPFDSITKTMTVTVKKNQAEKKFIKGAPESVLSICDKILIGRQKKSLVFDEKEKIVAQVEKWAKKGLRVLAFADGDTFLGMTAIHDAPRPEVLGAVKRAHAAGIKIVMITGDNEKTAEAVGVVSGIVNHGDEILTGVQLDTYDDQKLKQILPKVKVFARTNPFQKHRIVKLYQELGEIVAVTGDGVNDAVALKQADVGVAMGLVGTDVARETADMVITDDNFASIVNAVEEGRNIIKNLKNAIKYLLTCNITEAIALTSGLVLGIQHLFYPIQLLYINLVTDGFPALSLSFSPKNPHLMELQSAKKQELLQPAEKKYIFTIGLMASILVLTSYFVYSRLGTGINKTAAFSVLTIIQSFIFIDLWLSHRSLHKSLRHLLSPLFFAAFFFPLAAQYFIIRIDLTAKIFKINTVSLLTYVEFVFFASLILLGIKFIKRTVKL
ncbi:cation-translocating P-type ATPase [Candidatus Roizmanbacteria bacterium]|jgi:Ca2+-transporting ATPase|nr:cation-translocating P-type ATPase [Candidatus Roizmanbacteria bacterium]